MQTEDEGRDENENIHACTNSTRGLTSGDTRVPNARAPNLIKQT